jgi:hypothetical protein
MVMSELKYEKLGDMMPFYPRSTLVIRKQFVDAAITELKAIIHELESIPHTDNSAVIERLSNENECLKAKLEDVQATAYTESVDAGMRERKLKRTLWLSRASEASKEVNYWTCQDESSYVIVDFNVRHETIVSYKSPHHRPYKWILIWENVERKCRAKAKEYE